MTDDEVGADLSQQFVNVDLTWTRSSMTSRMSSRLLVSPVPGQPRARLVVLERCAATLGQ